MRCDSNETRDPRRVRSWRRRRRRRAACLQQLTRERVGRQAGEQRRKMRTKQRGEYQPLRAGDSDQGHLFDADYLKLPAVFRRLFTEDSLNAESRPPSRHPPPKAVEPTSSSLSVLFPDVFRVASLLRCSSGIVNDSMFRASKNVFWAPLFRHRR